jgi:hypothetical protein
MVSEEKERRTAKNSRMEGLGLLWGGLNRDLVWRIR